VPIWREAIQKAINIIQEQFLELKQLKLLDIILVFKDARVLARIAILISKQVLKFKIIYKG
jgi:hypothetical protein